MNKAHKKEQAVKHRSMTGLEWIASLPPGLKRVSARLSNMVVDINAVTGVTHMLTDGLVLSMIISWIVSQLLLLQGEELLCYALSLLNISYNVQHERYSYSPSDIDRASHPCLWRQSLHPS